MTLLYCHTCLITALICHTFMPAPGQTESLELLPTKEVTNYYTETGKGSIERTNSIKSWMTKPDSGYIYPDGNGGKLLYTREGGVKVGNRLYYVEMSFGQRFSHGKECDYTVSHDDIYFNDVRLERGKRVKKLYFECKLHDKCCGLECCRNDIEASGGAFYIILLFLIMFLMVALCYGLAMCLQSCYDCTHHWKNEKVELESMELGAGEKDEEAMMVGTVAEENVFEDMRQRQERNGKQALLPPQSVKQQQLQLVLREQSIPEEVHKHKDSFTTL